MKLFDHIHLLKFDLSERIRSYLYLIVDSGEAALIDAHIGTEAEKVIRAIEEIIELDQLSMVVLTHGHFDHIGTCPLLVENTDAKVAAHVADAWFIEEPWSQFQTLYHFRNPSKDIYHWILDMVGGRGVKVTNFLRDGDILKVGSIKLDVIHSPGHSPGSICLYDQETRALFAGDVLTPSEWFKDRLGPFLDARSHIRSLERLFEMDIEVLLPGHEPIRKGAEVGREISRHMNRFEVIESTVFQVLSETDDLTLSEIMDRVVERVFGQSDGRQVALGEWWTIHAYLQKLCFEGRLAQGRGPVWRAIKR